MGYYVRRNFRLNLPGKVGFDWLRRRRSNSSQRHQRDGQDDVRDNITNQASLELADHKIEAVLIRSTGLAECADNTRVQSMTVEQSWTNKKFQGGLTRLSRPPPSGQFGN